MTISCTCPSCGRDYTVADTAAGQIGTCGQCGEKFRVHSSDRIVVRAPPPPPPRVRQCPVCGERISATSWAPNDWRDQRGWSHKDCKRSRVVVDDSPGEPVPQQSNVRKGAGLGFGMFFGFIAGGITFVVIIVVLCVGGLVAITTMGTSSNKTFGNVAGAVGGASKQKDKAK